MTKTAKHQSIGQTHKSAAPLRSPLPVPPDGAGSSQRAFAGSPAEFRSYTSIDDFVHTEIPRLRLLQLPHPPLAYVLENKQMLLDGLWLEFGVHKGYSVNIMAQYTDQPVYGFDSFVGLPEDWRNGALRGRYNVDGILPKVGDNVRLVPGWFDETIPGFLVECPGNIALMHIDCDIYSSTKSVLTLLGARIVAGTVIVFDELFNYPEYREHELKAFYEFLHERKAGFEWIGTKGPIEIDPDKKFERFFYDSYRGFGLRITHLESL